MKIRYFYSKTTQSRTSHWRWMFQVHFTCCTRHHPFFTQELERLSRSKTTSWTSLLQMTALLQITNLSIKTRRKKLSKLSSYYSRGIVYFQITLEEALERNKHRDGKFIPESILKRMHHQFEVPTKEEGFDYIESVQSENWHKTT